MHNAERRKLMETPEGRLRVQEYDRLRYARRKAQGDPNAYGRDRKPGPGPAWVGIDGEGLTDAEGRHVYALLAASTGEQVSNPAGLDTRSCLEWLLQVSCGNRRLVGYAVTYDASCILRDLGPALETLWRTHRVTWQGYSIEWFPGHTLEIRQGTRKAILWDVFGFYQCSFTRALEDWGIGTHAERLQLRRQKERRAEFRALDPTLVEYNRLECRLLVGLVQALAETLRRAGIEVSRWDGAGAIASALLSSHGAGEEISRYRQRMEPPQVMRAYFGGRSQAVRIGRFSGTVYHYDLNSAYPAQMAGLPSLDGARWQQCDDYLPDEEFALWAVEWHVGKTPRSNKHYPLTPFPFRGADGEITYPVSGRGWYWASQVRVAMQAWPGKIKIHTGIILHTSGRRPWGWVRDLYRQRQEYRAAGDARHIILKFGLNALYGKLAQGAGVDGKRPAYQCYTLAGLVTAGTQAALLEAALTDPGACIAFGTDGIWCDRPLLVDEGPGLGQWKSQTVEDLFLLNPSLYAHGGPGKWLLHTSGYQPGEFPLGQLLRAWDSDREMGSASLTVRRFLGVGSALVENRLADCGSWVRRDVRISCCPGEGFPGPPVGEWIYWLQGERGKSEVSAAYSPKTARVELERTGAVSLLRKMEQPDPGAG